MNGMTMTVDASRQEKILMRGNEAVEEGAIRAGCSHYFGYPITCPSQIFYLP